MADMGAASAAGLAGGSGPAGHLQGRSCHRLRVIRGGRGSDDSADDNDDEVDRSAGDTPEGWSRSDNEYGQGDEAVPLDEEQGNEQEEEEGKKGRAKGPVLELAGGERMTVSARSLLTEQVLYARVSFPLPCLAGQCL